MSPDGVAGGSTLSPVGQRCTVSFIVPCYGLAHLLAECVNSILAQTYQDFEVLIMDDCSPDNTAEIANSIQDPRVRHIRNQRNLGHLQNYNRGIALSRGQFIWLISADDRLRCSYVLDRYVRIMEEHPEVGYVCCPGIRLVNGEEKGRLQCGYFGPQDKIFKGPDFIHASLCFGYGLLAPSVLVRRECYEKLSMFPTDMPHQGDWYLWLRWALSYDVAYLSDPMVNYRSHDLNIMKDLVDRFPEKVFNDEVAVLWRIRAHCEERMLRRLVDECEDRLARKYARAASSAIYRDDYSWGTGNACHWRLTPAQCLGAIESCLSSSSDGRRMQGKFAEYLGNQHWRHRTFAEARRSYLSALNYDWRLPRVWCKLLALDLGLGFVGIHIRRIQRRLMRLRGFLDERPNQMSKVNDTHKIM